MPLYKKLLCLLTAIATLFSLSGCMLDDILLYDDTPPAISKKESSATTATTSKPAVATKTTAKTNSISIHSAINYYTSAISANEKKVYSEIYKGIMNYQKHIEITPGVVSSDDISDFITFVTSVASDIHQLSDNYGMYTDDNDYVTSLDMNYTRNSKIGNAELQKLKTKVNIICKKVESFSDYNKLMYFHNYILNCCSYNEKAKNPYSAYGCLVDGQAVCEGYSKAFALLCLNSGIPCINIMGSVDDDETDNQPHMWNMVRLDGKWYHLDVTWDDPKDVFDSDYKKYDYFNVTDEMINKDHRIIPNKYMKYPTANSIDQNYFVKEHLFLTNNADTKKYVAYAIKKSLANSERYIRFRCSSDMKYNAVVDEMFNSDDNNSGFFNLLEDVIYANDYYVATDEYSFIESPETRVITVQLRFM